MLIDKRETIVAPDRADLAASRALSVVYTELLDFDGDEIYFRDDPALDGQDLRRGAARLRGLLR